MKLTMKILALLSVVIVASGCSNNNPNVNSPCTYEGVEIDTNKIAVISYQALLGEWTLKSFIDLSDCSIENEPDSINSLPIRSVVIRFEDSIHVSGHTNNEFYGNYSLVGKKIEMSVNSLTEINEHKWTKKFLEAAPNTEYIFIEDSKLFIFFYQTSKVMVFTKNERK